MDSVCYQVDSRHIILIGGWDRKSLETKKKDYVARQSPFIQLVGSERFELSTYGLRVRCSTS
jgi:hypothetical protein